MTTPEFIAEVNEAIDVYEEAIGGPATGTHRMIEKYGHLGALAKLVQTSDLQPGFKLLRDRNKLDKTFEQVIVNHPDLFTKQVVEAAQWRLDEAINCYRK